MHAQVNECLNNLSEAYVHLSAMVKLKGADPHQQSNLLMKPSAIINSVCDKEVQPRNDAASAAVANKALCRSGNVKQTCSAKGRQQQICCDCALYADRQQSDDFTFCSSECCGRPCTVETIITCSRLVASVT